MLPRLVLNVRRAVRRIRQQRADYEMDLSSARNEASWQDMLLRVYSRDADFERRLAEAERALNRLNLH